MAVAVEPRFQMLGADGVVVVVLDVVLARPGDLDRGADHARQQCRFGDVVGLGFAAKAAAEQGYVDRDVGFIETEDLSDGLARLRRVLRRRPDLAGIGDPMRDSIGHLHLGVRQMRHKIIGRDMLCCGGERAVNLALVAHDLPGWRAVASSSARYAVLS
jgi:hypothetical protein